jgi:hypothetical protein
MLAPFHDRPDLASWSFGPEDAFHLADAPLIAGTTLDALILVRFYVTNS